MGQQFGYSYPKKLANEIYVSQGAVFELKGVRDGFLFRPRRRTSYSLGRMLRRVNKDTLPLETDWGPPIGREV
jgi:antitoxin component of MazEF toxin-antitoxin module